MNPIRRRSFLAKSVNGAAGIMAAGALPALQSSLVAGPLGANNRIRVAVLGLRGRGSGHAKGFAEIEGVEVAALCDPDRRLLDDRAKSIAPKN